MALICQKRMGNAFCSRQTAPNTRRPSPRTVLAKAAVNVEQLKALKEELHGYITSKHCNPIIVRLAWHESGTYNKEIKDWPARGGANGAIRFDAELKHGANAGLTIARNLLTPLKKKYPDVSYADLYQMASAVAVEAAGGPKIPMKYGRRDVESDTQCPPEGNLPDAGHPFHDGSKSPADHIRRIFYRMGFTDQEIVVLSGGHTIGRSRPDRSGWGKESTKYTKDGPGNKGGQSWTADWLVFNNSYFVDVKEKKDAELLVLPTDACIFEDEGFRPFAEKYAASQDAFFTDYAAAHAKLSELGVEWVPGAPVTI